MRKLKVWLIIASALTSPLIFLVAGIYQTMLPLDGTYKNRVNQTVGTDFRAFYIAGVMAAEGKAPEIYDLETYNAQALSETGTSMSYSWSYPPVAFFYFIPLSFLAYIPAMILWGLLPMLAAAGMFYRILPHRITPALAILSPPLVLDFITGQNGTLNMVIVGGGLLLLPIQPIAAGLVFALAIYKPHLALLIPVCLLAGAHYRAFAAMTAAGLALILASLIVFGLDSWLAFLEQMNQHMGYVDSGKLPLDRMPTIYSAILRLFDDTTVAGLAQGAVSLVVIWLAAWAWRRGKAPVERALTLTAATMLVTPYAFDYDMAILAIPFAWILKDYLVHRSPVLDLLALLGIWFVPFIVFLADSSIGVVLLILLLAYGLYRNKLTAGRAAVGPRPVDVGLV